MPSECVKAMSSDLLLVQLTQSRLGRQNQMLDGHIVTGSGDIAIIKITKVTKLQVFLIYSN